MLNWERCLPNRGKVLTQQGHAAYPGWADLLSDICPISDCCNTHIPVFMILPTHSIPVVLQFLSSANHPDNWLTVARQSTICLSEYYNKKPDNLTVFQKFSFLLKISVRGNFYSYRLNQFRQRVKHG